MNWWNNYFWRRRHNVHRFYILLKTKIIWFTYFLESYILCTNININSKCKILQSFYETIQFVLLPLFYVFWLTGLQSQTLARWGTITINTILSSDSFPCIKPYIRLHSACTPNLSLSWLCLLVNGYDKNIRLFIHYCKQKANWSIINKLFLIPDIIPILRKHSTTSIFLDWRSFCLLFPAPLTFHWQWVSGVDPQWGSKPPKCLHCVLIHRRRGDCDEVWINSQSNSFSDKIKKRNFRGLESEDYFQTFLNEDIFMNYQYFISDYSI